MAMLQSDTIEERILYWLSLDLQVRALAERLLQRFAVTVGDLPASAAHHHAEPGGLYRHSLEVALKALEEFEGDRKSTRLNSSHGYISYAVFCLKKKKNTR